MKISGSTFIYPTFIQIEYVCIKYHTIIVELKCDLMQD